MLKVMKWLFVLVFTLLLLCAACHGPCRIVVCEKALEGMVGGFLVGIVLAFSKLQRMKTGYGRIPQLVVLLVRHEACSGLVGGLLVGLAIAAVILAVG